MKLRYCLPAVLFSLAACTPPSPDGAAPRPKDLANEAAATGTAVGSTEDAGPVELAAVRASVKANMPDFDVDEIRGTPMPGIYQIQVGMNFGYVTADGRYLIAGDLTDLKTHKEITEETRRGARVALVDKLYKEGFIEFAPETEPAKYTVTVFTDVDCGYCRMLHRQIKDYNARGIAVRYLFFPRTGANTPSFFKAEEVWCSADRKQALTQAKTGIDLNGQRSCGNPVMKDLQAAAELELRGTPSIILPSGELVFGYRSPDDLLKELNKPAGASALDPLAG